MIDGLIWMASMGTVAIVGTVLENRKERKEMRARHNKRFEEIKRNNRRRQGLE